ncbi:hypothetical protein ABIB82_007673 [Bradyrhizobium sp. i1.8.4]|uniref:hypothetical protein n=1 Tax=unclassified Bradyrhizobium TaxID=2631580 RepID=UPI003D1F6DD5
MAGRPSIADRIDRELQNAQLENPEAENHQLEAELDEDVDVYAKDRGRRIKAALKKLREVGAGNALATDVRRLVPMARTQPSSAGGPRRKRRRTGSSQRRWTGKFAACPG